MRRGQKMAAAAWCAFALSSGGSVLAGDGRASDSLSENLKPHTSLQAAQVVRIEKTTEAAKTAHKVVLQHSDSAESTTLMQAFSSTPLVQGQKVFLVSTKSSDTLKAVPRVCAARMVMCGQQT